MAAERQAGTRPRWTEVALRFRISWVHGTHCLKLQLPAALRAPMLIAAAGTRAALLIAAVVLWARRCCQRSWSRQRTVMFGISLLLSSLAPVDGEVSLVRSHSVMALRS